MKTLNELITIRVQKSIDNKGEQEKRGYNNTVVETEAHLMEKVNIGIPLRYKEAEITEEYIEKVSSALKNNKGIYFYGPVGTGKTYLLYGILRRLRAIGSSPYHTSLWNVPNTLANLRKAYSDGGGGEEEIDKEIKFNEILLLDDFGAEKITEWNTEIMYRLINYRHENMLPTFFASNLSIEELAERSGDRLASRIVESCDVIKIGGDDRRIKRKQLTAIVNKEL